ncbi:MAG: hypothetical protein HZA36_03845 [Parcubacteria group bacterium]|nr:hypothetical protein [Parcubacteria group bacterium]
MEWLPDIRVLAQYGTYAHDRLIPEQVLVELAAIAGFGFFDSLEVLTYQNEGTFEVLLVGYRGREMFRVARWGESLRPLKNIFQRISLVRKYEWAKKLFVGDRVNRAMICLSIAVGLLLVFGWMCSELRNPYDVQANQFIFSYCPSVFCASIAFFVISYMLRHCDMRKLFILSRR